MNCVMCGATANKVVENRVGHYRAERVEVPTEFFRCSECGEDFFTPAQMKSQVLAVKNEVRRKHGLLSPEKIVAIRNKFDLSQAELEMLLGAGPKVVVRWESGKVIQGSGHDKVLRLMDNDPKVIESLRQMLQAAKAEEEKERGRTKMAANF